MKREYKKDFVSASLFVVLSASWYNVESAKFVKFNQVYTEGLYFTLRG